MFFRVDGLVMTIFIGINSHCSCVVLLNTARSPSDITAILTEIHLHGLVVTFLFGLNRLARQIHIFGFSGPVAAASLQLIVMNRTMAQALLTLLG